MAFCGQCGLLLPAQATKCPRCGFAVDPGWAPEEQHPNDPTMIGVIDTTQRAGSHTPLPNNAPQSDAASDPSSFTGYNSATQKAFDPASTPDPQPPTSGASYPGYQQQGTIPAAYSSPGISSPGASSPGYSQPGISSPGGYSQPGISSPGASPGYSQPGSTPNNNFSAQQAAYPGYPPPYNPVYPPQPPQPQPRRGAPWGVIVLVLLALLFVGSTTALFVVGPTRLAHMFTGGGNTPQATVGPSGASTPDAQVTPTPQDQPTPTPQDQPTPTPQPSPSPTASPVQQAQTVVKNYFTYINSKDYQSAYNLWQNNPQSYQDFANGFSDTKHDDWVFGDAPQQSDGTVQVNLTLTATSNSGQQTVYTGYYIVGPMSDGTWKIVTAKLAKA